MPYESIKKQNTQEKIINPESQKNESHIDNEESIVQKTQKEIENLQRRDNELNRVKALRSELTKKEETPVLIKEEPKQSKLKSFFRKVALGLGITSALAGKVEGETKQNIPDKNQIDIEQTTATPPSNNEHNISWEDVSGNLKKEINSPITKESTNVVIPKFKHTNKEKEEYFNPPIERGITSGDKQLDFLYYHQWLMDVPIIGKIIKDQARMVAEGSRGFNTIDLKIAKENAKIDKYTGQPMGYEEKNSKQPSLLDQFFSKKPIFPISKYKPLSDYLTFLPSYSVKGEFESLSEESKTQIIKNVLGTITDRPDSMFFSDFPPEKRDSILAGINKSDSIIDNLTNKKTPIFKQLPENTSLLDSLHIDLAGHKEGAAWDKDINLPYISISDAWDFEPNHYTKKWADSNEFKSLVDPNTPGSLDTFNMLNEENRQKNKIQSTLLNKAGYPFKIYDRFYFDPETKEYISDEKIEEIKSKNIK